SRVTRQSAFSAIPIARWRIDQRAFQPGRTEAFCNRSFRMPIGTKNLDAAESSVGRRRESIEKRMLLKESVEVRREFQHAINGPPYRTAQASGAHPEASGCFLKCVLVMNGMVR